MTDTEYMMLALEEARKAEAEGEIPIGALVVYRDLIIAAAHNEKEGTHDPTAHAEITALRKAARFLGTWRLTGASLYVTIEPCPMCAGALIMSRIDRVVYGSPDYKAGAAESLFNVVDNKALNHQLRVRAGVLEDQCTEIMKRFFAQCRSKAD